MQNIDTTVAALTLQSIINQCQAALQMLESAHGMPVRTLPQRSPTTGRERIRTRAPSAARRITSSTREVTNGGAVDQKFLAAVQKGATVAQLAKQFRVTESAIRARLNGLTEHGWNVVHEGNTYRAESRATA